MDEDQNAFFISKSKKTKTLLNLGHKSPPSTFDNTSTDCVFVRANVVQLLLCSDGSRAHLLPRVDILYERLLAVRTNICQHNHLLILVFLCECMFYLRRGVVKQGFARPKALHQ
jgi:hypothetical protein